MGEAAQRFFEEIGNRGYEPALEPFTGTILFELEDGTRTDRFFLSISKGEISVTKDGGAPDCTLRTDAKTFDAIVSGRINAMAAMLRGLIDIDGRGILLVVMQRLFPGASREPAGAATGIARRQA